MPRRSRRYRQLLKERPRGPVSWEEAVAWARQHGREGRDDTVEIHIRLALGAAAGGAAVRGVAQLPAGRPRKLKVAVLTANPAQQEAARKAGATLVGGEELIQEIKEQGGLAADVLVAHPEMMPRLAPVAKILGPQGLMPNPKDGTISTEPAKVVKELLGGQLPFKMDSSGNVHAAIARTSWPPEKILQNARAFLEAVEAAKPDKAPADFIRGITIATTFSPSVRIKI